MKSVKPKFEIKAIIYDRKGNVLSIGQNSYVKTHPLQAKYCKEAKVPHAEHKGFLHAELNAILKCRDLSKAHRISIFRFGGEGGGTPRLAKPCKACQLAIAATPIKIIEHT